jgi:hypothetical protein
MNKPAQPLQWPILSDEVVIQIHDFLNLALEIFEDHYGEQIQKFYEPLYEDSPELDLGGDRLF